MTYSVFAISGFLGLLVFVVARALQKRSSHPLPPGPGGLPILGNALQMPSAREWLKFSEWSREYGEIVHISALGQPIIILNTVKAATELFEKRSALYSDRPRMPMGGELVGYVDSVPLCPYDNRHREYRKLMFNTLAQRKVEDLYQGQEEKTRERLLPSFKSSPEKFLTHIRQTIATIVFKISHGYDVASENDPLVELAERANAEFSAACAPGAFAVDIFPILRYVPDWFPGTSWKAKAKKWRKTMEDLRDLPYEAVKKQIREGTAYPSFTSDLIEQNPAPTTQEERIFKWASGSFYSAGADTTVSAISSFILAMTLYPEVQKKAQAELDSVTGRTRLPSFTDRPKLPYIEALIKEVYRWNPVAPLALPHRLIQDDVYEGYHIPAGSILFANSWSIMHNPAMYPSPFEFNPERYLSSNNSKDGDDLGINPDPRAFAFGYGRRVCPGQYLADANIFIIAVTTLAVFDLAKGVDETGEVIEPSLDYAPGVISHPQPFQCHITVRSPEADKLIQEYSA